MLRAINRKILRNVVLGLFVILAAAEAAFACKCEVRSLSTYYRSADSIVKARTLTFTPGKHNPSTAVLEISEVWKRDLPKQIKVLTEGSCSYDFVVGTENLLYLRLTPAGEFSTMQCQGNLAYAKSGRSLRWLKRYGKKRTILIADVLWRERNEIVFWNLLGFSSFDQFIVPNS